MKNFILVLVLALTGCQAMLHVNGEDSQAVVDQRVVGMSVGEFFQRYGAPRSRDESRDGTLGFDWASGAENVAAGPLGPENLICRLRISTDRNGRIVAAPIMRDGQGKTRLSRCVELFDPA